MSGHRYGIVHAAFWTDEKVQGWSDRAKLAALYMLTCEHSNAAGAYRLPLAYLCADLGWSERNGSETVAELLATGFLSYCERSKFVVIHNRLKYDPPANPNTLKAIISAISKVPADHPGLPFVFNALEPLCERFNVPFEPLANRSETVSEPLPNGIPNPNPLSRIPTPLLRARPRAKTAWPDGLELDDDMRAYATERGVQPAPEFERFRNYHTAKGSTFADWHAAWRTWVGNAVKFAKQGKASGPPPQPPRKSSNWKLGEYRPGYDLPPSEDAA